MSYYQIIINDFAQLSDGVLGNSRLSIDRDRLLTFDPFPLNCDR
ncbi:MULTISPECIES: hypothetical protein [unclassified Microcystis]|nr:MULTISPECIES: hypothetical protein [unclassified Microcystis]MCZ8201477.1 hypothetical protein [Microcystis sp. LE19-55.1A]MCZ8306314.1 hypothetical protein [Microcystis sp. LE19-98.1E]